MAANDEFEQQALTHLPALLALARRLVRNQAESEDLVQETLLKAFRARSQYEHGTHLKAWLFKILKNTFINRYHRGQLERSLVAGPVADPIADGWMSVATMRSLRDGEANALRPELREHLAAALDQIPEEFRIVVLLADVEELSYREIADSLECPIGTVMSRLHRGRRLLRTHLWEIARDLGVLRPEDFVGDARPPAADEPAAIDLDAYRDQQPSRKVKP
jgi:RNA polymerase sigma-70 factor (ECF subfamily)